MTAWQRVTDRRASAMLTLGAPEQWMDRAACSPDRAEEWWAVTAAGQHAAAAYCREQCPVIAECGERADRLRIRDGVWAGETEHQRRIRLAQRRERTYPDRTCAHCGKQYTGRGDRYCTPACDKASRQANCGTPAAAARHRQHGETVDPLCRLAESMYRANLRAKRKERATA